MTDTPYIIAEIGSNHNGDMDLCRQMIDAAIESGADAVKFQSFSDKSLISEAEYARRMDYGDSAEDKNRHFGTLKEMVNAYWMRPDQHHEIAEYARSNGIEFLSTPFSNAEVDLLEECNVPLYKVASMDVNHPTLLEYIGSKGKPVYLSTGMATLGEIDTAIQILEKAGAASVTPLHCTSVYPPTPEIMNINNIVGFREIFDRLVGYSDHTIGTDVPLIALSLGACVIEKHFTIDKSLPGWDHWVSADPKEMKQIVEYSKMSIEELQDRAHKVENFDIILGTKHRILSDREKEKIAVMRRCIVAKTDLPEGHVLKSNDVDYKRPGSGIRPDELNYIIGRELTRDINYDHEFKWSDFGPGV